MKACVCVCLKSLQWCPTLCDPMDCSSPGCSVYGILQARILEWVVMPSSGDLPLPRIEPGSPALQADSLPSEPPGNLLLTPNSLQREQACSQPFLNPPTLSSLLRKGF